MNPSFIQLTSIAILAAMATACSPSGSSSPTNKVVGPDQPRGTFVSEGEIPSDTDLAAQLDYESDTYIVGVKEQVQTVGSKRKTIDAKFYGDSSSETSIQTREIVEVLKDKYKVRESLVEEDSNGYRQASPVTVVTHLIANGEEVTPKEVVTESEKTEAGAKLSLEKFHWTRFCGYAKSKPIKSTLKIEKGLFKFAEGGQARVAFRKSGVSEFRMFCQKDPKAGATEGNVFEIRGTNQYVSISYAGKKTSGSAYYRSLYRSNDGTMIRGYYFETLTDSIDAVQ